MTVTAFGINSEKKKSCLFVQTIGKENRLCHITSPSVHCGGAECFPHNGLTDIGSNEERDARTKTISFLEQFIQEQNYQTSNKKLQ